MACSSLKVSSVKSDRLTVSPGQSDASLDSLISPYREELGKEMNRVVGRTVTDLTVQQPNSLMGQYITDMLVRFAKDSLLTPEQMNIPVTCFLNTGGLRAPFSKGNITVGDVYKLMPFDNQLVLLKMPATSLSGMAEYLKVKGGDPISGLTYENGTVKVNAGNSDFFWVVTSDFLANGGDKMYFFTRAVERINTPVLLRDVIIWELNQRPDINITDLQQRVKL